MSSKYNSLFVLHYKIYQLYSKIKKDVIDKVDIKDFLNRDEGSRLYYSFYLTTPLIKGSQFVIDYYQYGEKYCNPEYAEIHLYEHYKYTDNPLSINPFIINNLLGRELKYKTLTTGFYCFFKGALPKKFDSKADSTFRSTCEMNIPKYVPSYGPEYNVVTPYLSRVEYFHLDNNADGLSKDSGDRHITIRDDKYFQSKFGQYTELFRSYEGAYDIYAAIIDSIMTMMDFYGPWDIHFEALGS